LFSGGAARSPSKEGFLKKISPGKKPKKMFEGGGISKAMAGNQLYREEKKLFTTVQHI
jgi:hypothetical protein